MLSRTAILLLLTPPAAAHEIEGKAKNGVRKEESEGKIKKR
jgi:hypothetical protein